MMTIASRSCLLLGCSLTATVGQAASITGIDLQFIADSNPARAEFDRDIESTNAVKGRVTANLVATQADETAPISSGIGINAAASYTHDADIEELGETLLRLSVDTFRENRRGPGSPFYRLGVGVNYLDSETDIRDSVIADVSASINFQPTDFFDMTFGIRAEGRDADTEVFDTTKTQLFTTFNFSPFSHLVLRTGLRYVTGNEVSTATPTLAIVNAADVIEPDPAFGGVAARRFAYLLDADSLIAEAGVGYQITRSTEANLLYRYIDTDATDGIGYERNMLELTVSLNLQ